MTRNITILITLIAPIVTSCSSTTGGDNVPPPNMFKYYECMEGYNTKIEYEKRLEFCKMNFT